MALSIALIYRKHILPNNLTRFVWENIDMQGLGLAFKSLDTPSCHFTSKMPFAKKQAVKLSKYAEG